MTASPRALVLDYGEVLSRPQRPGALGLMATLLGVSEPTLHEVYWRYRRDYDLGLPVEEYWAQVGTDLGVTIDGRLRDELIAIDIDSWTDYREETWELAMQFRQHGGRLAMLSNGVPEIVARIRSERDLPSLFDVVVISYEVALAKPEPEIYRLTLNRLGVLPGDTLFVDDRPENIEAAAALGIRTLPFTGDGSVDELRRLLGV
ncbi:MAG TPA: HAD family phosphatase [Vicinamibacterales bacterium]